MRVVVQRVAKAGVKVDGQVTASTGCGLLCLVGIGRNDTEENAEYLAVKTANLRIFEDDCGKMNLSIRQAGGEILSVPQFTLLGRLKKGSRPSFDEAAEPAKALALWEAYNSFLVREGIPVQKGSFGDHMEVSLINDGPVTIILKSKESG